MSVLHRGDLAVGAVQVEAEGPEPVQFTRGTKITSKNSMIAINVSTRMKIRDSRGILGLILMLTPRHSLCFNARTCPPTSQSNRLSTHLYGRNTPGFI